MLLGLLLIPLNGQSTIFSTNYTLSLLMPVMLWGAMRFGYRCIAMIWTPVLIIIIHFHYRYLPFLRDMTISWPLPLRAIWCSHLLLLIWPCWRPSASDSCRVRRMAFLDPVVHMPNLRALSRSLDSSMWSVLCFYAFLSWSCWGAIMALCCAFNINKTG